MLIIGYYTNVYFLSLLGLSRTKALFLIINVDAYRAFVVWLRDYGHRQTVVLVTGSSLLFLSLWSIPSVSLLFLVMNLAAYFALIVWVTYFRPMATYSTCCRRLNGCQFSVSLIDIQCQSSVFDNDTFLLLLLLLTYFYGWVIVYIVRMTSVSLHANCISGMQECFSLIYILLFLFMLIALIGTQKSFIYLLASSWCPVFFCCFSC